MRVSLFLNHACNFACTYCYGGAKFDRPMPLNVAFAGVELALRGGCGPAQVSFFGGEPLMEFERIQQVVAHARERAREGGREVRFLVPTNGSLLSGERLDWLLEQRFTVAVSLDGCRKAHDACRRLTGGGSSYDVVARNLGELLARSPVGVKVIAVLHPANAHHGADSLGALLELGVRNISMNLDYEADWDEEAREAFEAALDALGDRYVQAWRDGHVFSLNLLALIVNCIHIPDQIFNLRVKIKKSMVFRDQGNLRTNCHHQVGFILVGGIELIATWLPVTGSCRSQDKLLVLKVIP